MWLLFHVNFSGEVLWFLLVGTRTTVLGSITGLGNEVPRLLFVLPIVDVAWAESKVISRTKKLLLRNEARYGISCDLFRCMRLNTSVKYRNSHYGYRFTWVSTIMKEMDGSSRTLWKSKKYSDTGNRTRITTWRVSGDSHYTISDVLWRLRMFWRVIQTNPD